MHEITCTYSGFRYFSYSLHISVIFRLTNKAKKNACNSQICHRKNKKCMSFKTLYLIIPGKDSESTHRYGHDTDTDTQTQTRIHMYADTRTHTHTCKFTDYLKIT